MDRVDNSICGVSDTVFWRRGAGQEWIEYQSIGCVDSDSVEATSGGNILLVQYSRGLKPAQLVNNTIGAD